MRRDGRPITQHNRIKSEKVTVLFNSRRFRRNPATTGRHGAVPDQVPQQPHAATEPTPNPFAGLYPYLPSTLAGIRAAIERNRAEAIKHDAQSRDFETKAREEADWAAHKRETADDFERLLVLVSADAQRNAYQAAPGAAMGQDQLLNGWQQEPAAASRDGDTLTLAKINGGAR